MDFPEIGMGWIVVIFVAAAIVILATAPPIGPNATRRMRNQRYGRAASKSDGGDGGFDSDSDGGGDGGGD